MMDECMAKVMMTAGRLLQYRWQRTDRGVDDGMDGGLMYSRHMGSEDVLGSEDVVGCNPNVKESNPIPATRYGKDQSRERQHVIQD